MNTRPLLAPFLMTAALAAAVTLAVSPVTARPADRASAAKTGPLQITSSMLVESRSAAADGTTRIALVKPTRVAPGDRIIFVVAYRNTGAQTLSNVVLANPLPKGIAYRQPSPGSQAPELSVDGTDYGALAGLRIRSLDGATRPATPDDVTHVRWRIASPLAAGSQGQFAFQAVLK